MSIWDPVLYLRVSLIWNVLYLECPLFGMSFLHLPYMVCVRFPGRKSSEQVEGTIIERQEGGIYYYYTLTSCLYIIVMPYPLEACT